MILALRGGCVCLLPAEALLGWTPTAPPPKLEMSCGFFIESQYNEIEFFHQAGIQRQALLVLLLPAFAQEIQLCLILSTFIILEACSFYELPTVTVHF